MRFTQQIEINATPQEVWDRVADPTAIGRAMGPGMTVHPEDPDRESGRGARYRILMSVGAALVGGQVEIVEFEAPREFAWVSFTGVSHRLRLRIRPLGRGSTLTLRFSYDAPGILGSLADVVALPRIRSLLEGGLQAIKHSIEQGAPPAPRGPSLITRLGHELGNIGVLARAGIVAPMRPDKLPRIALAAGTWGPTLGTGVAAGAIRHGDRAMVEDELGTLSYSDLDRRTNAIAAGLAALGVAEGDAVGLMARNHRGFVEAVLALAKLGADVLLLNTAFSAPQITEVCQRERPTALIYDQEFAELLAEAGEGRRRIIADAASDQAPGLALLADAESHEAPGLAQLADAHAAGRPSTPDRAGRLTILTSGTTGTPKGASRGAGDRGGIPSLDAPAGLLERIPLRSGMRIGLAAPMFHAWGLLNFALGTGLGASFVMLRKFSPEAWLAAIEEHRVQALIVVPVMLQRILQLPEEARARYDTSSLQIVSASGSALPGDLATRWMDAFGDTLYNMYGSTEVSSATIATPQDMRAAPGTAGRPTRGTTVKLLDEDGYEVQQGTTGRIFVGNSALFEGYSGGGDKLRVSGMMSSGDVGRFDESGRLFVEGRDDEMIVSGGENVFPKEIEDVLARHPAVAEAAAIGVDDEDFGQRLRAFVALRDGAGADEDELKAHVKEQLARYKVPREIVFLSELPRNATGKVLKRELAEREE
jgi:acyl-CoA synthetase (AMP-forming)/AMP-acid ligase II/carbon monoxide dehydrogenase subunit G